MTPDDDDLQGRNFQQQGPTATETGLATAGAAAALAALAAGALIRAHELASLADAVGRVNINVDSTAIRSLAYHLTTGAMAVTFTDGSVYPYPPVSMSNFLEFVNATSKGQFYNRYVRGRWG
jgi:lysyl-tRNA synthetase class 2